MFKKNVGIDYNSLEKKIYKKSFNLKDVENRLDKVAFDVVRFKDGDESSNLWKVEQEEDGNYIVSLYEEGDVKTASSNPWEVTLSKTADVINIFYKGDHLCKLASSDLQIPSEELSMVEKYLPKSLNSNKSLVNKLVNELDLKKKGEIIRKYPELGNVKG